jgi:hypothetical protein
VNLFVFPGVVEIPARALRRVSQVVVVSRDHTYAFDFVPLRVSSARDGSGGVSYENRVFIRAQFVSDERKPDGPSTLQREKQRERERE